MHVCFFQQAMLYAIVTARSDHGPCGTHAHAAAKQLIAMCKLLIKTVVRAVVSDHHLPVIATEALLWAPAARPPVRMPAGGADTTTCSKNTQQQHLSASSTHHVSADDVNERSSGKHRQLCGRKNYKCC
jgi:hypothetical protein